MPYTILQPVTAGPFNRSDGAGDGTRTRDGLLGRQVLYQTELLPHAPNITQHPEPINRTNHPKRIIRYLPGEPSFSGESIIKVTGPSFTSETIIYA